MKKTHLSKRNRKNVSKTAAFSLLSNSIYLTAAFSPYSGANFPNFLKNSLKKSPINSQKIRRSRCTFIGILQTTTKFLFFLFFSCFKGGFCFFLTKSLLIFFTKFFLAPGHPFGIVLFIEPFLTTHRACASLLTLLLPLPAFPSFFFLFRLGLFIRIFSHFEHS